MYALLLLLCGLQVAVDFMSPEGLPAVLTLRDHLRTLELAQGGGQQQQQPHQQQQQGGGGGGGDRKYAEKLQSQLILLRAALTAEGLSSGRQNELVPPLPELPQPAVVPLRKRKSTAAGAAAGKLPPAAAAATAKKAV